MVFSVQIVILINALSVCLKDFLLLQENVSNVQITVSSVTLINVQNAWEACICMKDYALTAQKCYMGKIVRNVTNKYVCVAILIIIRL